MNKELFVSSTPHEIKVGMVEDDLLAEIYLERENEYTLAGSIYKGRVTRVLPGMQSAFVDIGLERDAFLYVSDFMELEEGDDVDDIPTTGPAPARQYSASVQGDPRPIETNGAEGSEEHPATVQFSVGASDIEEPAEGESKGGGWRGRRRRRPRRGESRTQEARTQGAASVEPETQEFATEDSRNQDFRNQGSRDKSRNQDSRSHARPHEPARDAARSQRSSEYGPPPGYTPIVLPGESISKYARRGPAETPRNTPAQTRSESAVVEDQALSQTFPHDEPMFAASVALSPAETTTVTETPVAKAVAVSEPTTHSMRQTGEVPVVEVGTDAWDREQRKQHERNVAAVFGDTGTEAQAHVAEAPIEVASAVETLEQEEIEEGEEADLVSYAEELEEEFDELEEEIQAADGHVEEVSEDKREAHATASAFETEEVEEGAEANRTAALTQEAAQQAVEEEEFEEAELEEAQAEAEALLEAEARGNGTVDAQVEVRAPVQTAGYTQRTQRQGTDPRPRRDGGDQRGRRGGRRFPRREPQNVPLISDLLKEGQEILVQIAKEPIAKKGARITSHIALPGRFLVYMPTVNHTGVSRKIASEEERQRLKRIINSEKENGHGGFIVRTAAQGADEEELRADIRFLKGLWNEIKTRSETAKPPALIYHDLNVVERVLRDQVTSDFSTIWVDTEQEYERILRFANRFQPALVRKVKFYSKEVPLFEQFGLSEEINKALKSKVWLKSGGYIVINQTEALVAIDVNTGKYVGKTARLEDTIVKTNVDAIKEIVRQIRLRDLGGIIIIDFIDMDERRNRQKVMQALEEALRNDRAPSKVLQFNDFGLVAITRKRVKQSLERTIGSPCPYCESTGYVKSVQTVCNDIYIEMRKMAKHLEHTDVILRVNPEVAKALKANNAKILLEIEDLSKRTVIVKSDPALHQEQFDIN